MCPCAGSPPRRSLFSEPLPARFNEVRPDRRRSETQAPACFSIIVAASTAGPTGFTEIKLYHLLRAPQPLKQVIKGKWGADGGVLDLHKEPFAWLAASVEGTEDRNSPRSMGKQRHTDQP